MVLAKFKTESVLITKRQNDISVRISEGSQVTVIYVGPSSSDHQIKNAAKDNNNGDDWKKVVEPSSRFGHSEDREKLEFLEYM